MHLSSSNVFITNTHLVLLLQEKPRTSPWDGTFKSHRLCQPKHQWHSELVPINDIVPAEFLAQNPGMLITFFNYLRKDTWLILTLYESRRKQMIQIHEIGKFDQWLHELIEPLELEDTVHTLIVLYKKCSCVLVCMKCNSFFYIFEELSCTQTPHWGL